MPPLCKGFASVRSTLAGLAERGLICKCAKHACRLRREEGSGVRSAPEWDLQMRKRLQASPRREWAKYAKEAVKPSHPNSVGSSPTGRALTSPGISHPSPYVVCAPQGKQKLLPPLVPRRHNPPAHNAITLRKAHRFPLFPLNLKIPAEAGIFLFCHLTDLTIFVISFM